MSYGAVSYGRVTVRPRWRVTVRPRWRVTVRPRWRVTVRPRWRVRPTVRPRWRVTIRPRWRVRPMVRPRWRVTVRPRWRVTVRPRWRVNGKMNYWNARKSSKIVFLNFCFCLKSKVLKSSGDIDLYDDENKWTISTKFRGVALQTINLKIIT